VPLRFSRGSGRRILYPPFALCFFPRSLFCHHCIWVLSLFNLHFFFAGGIRGRSLSEEVRPFDFFFFRSRRPFFCFFGNTILVFAVRSTNRSFFHFWSRLPANALRLPTETKYIRLGVAFVPFPFPSAHPPGPLRSLCFPPMSTPPSGRSFFFEFKSAFSVETRCGPASTDGYTNLPSIAIFFKGHPDFSRFR